MDALLVAQGTILVLTPLSGAATPVLTPWSARGLTQTLEPITGGGGGGWTRRDVNGYLRSVADTRFRKFKSTITCRDGETPCLEDVWIGVTCEVSCTIERSYPTGGTPERPVVPGSVRTQGSITYYRPLLTMMITGIKTSFAEWPSIYDWSAELEEI